MHHAYMACGVATRARLSVSVGNYLLVPLTTTMARREIAIPGPQRHSVLRLVFHVAIVLFLTLLTQIGGIAYLIALAVSRLWAVQRFWLTPALYLFIYTIKLRYHP